MCNWSGRWPAKLGCLQMRRQMKIQWPGGNVSKLTIAPQGGSCAALAARWIDDMNLPTIYTLHEAAERMRLTPNALARLSRRTGHCSAVGRTLLFSEADLVALWESMRVVAKVPRNHQHAGYSEKVISEKAQAFLARGRRRPTA